MSKLTEQQRLELRRAFDLTQDSGVVDHYGAKKMLQIFNMNPTTDDVIKRYVEYNKNENVGLTFEEFEEMFEDYLLQSDKVPDALSRTLTDLFDGLINKTELRKILTEMGSEPFEPEEANEVINEISFDENEMICQEELREFLLNRVEMNITPRVQAPDDTGNTQDSYSPEPAKPRDQRNEC